MVQDVFTPDLVVELIEAEVRFRLRLDVALPLKAPDLLGCRQVHCQSPLLAIIKSVPEVRALCSAGITRPHSSYGPVRRPRATVTQGDVKGATLVPSGPLQITRITLPTCRAHYPGGPGRVHMSVASPSRAAFPGSQAGRHPRLHFRGLLRLHSNYGPLDRSAAQGGLCHRASIHPVTRTNRLPATRSNRQLSGWFLPPLVIRAFWAHYDREVVCDGISPFCPLLWQSSAEEIEDGVDEVPEVGMEPVVDHFPVQDAP